MESSQIDPGAFMSGLHRSRPVRHGSSDNFWADATLHAFLADHVYYKSSSPISTKITTTGLL